VRQFAQTTKRLGDSRSSKVFVWHNKTLRNILLHFKIEGRPVGVTES